MNIVVWSADPPLGHCTLNGPYIPEAAQMHQGKSIGRFSKDVAYRMSDLFPDDIELSDNFSVAGQLVVSAALKKYLEEVLESARVEFLPVSILNHKGRVASTDYFIVNVLDVVDCIDLERSGVKWSPLNKERITSCKALAFLPDSILAGLRLFRPKHWGDTVMMDKGLADELAAKGFTGLQFFAALGYNGFDSGGW